jgi:hypothetical protein
LRDGPSAGRCALMGLVVDPFEDEPPGTRRARGARLLDAWRLRPVKVAPYSPGACLTCGRIHGHADWCATIKRKSAEFERAWHASR